MLAALLGRWKRNRPRRGLQEEADGPRTNGDNMDEAGQGRAGSRSSGGSTNIADVSNPSLRVRDKGVRPTAKTQVFKTD